MGLLAMYIRKQGTVCGGTEGLCLLLRRLMYPCGYSDLIPCFGCPVPEICINTYYVMETLYSLQHHHLTPWWAPSTSEICWCHTDGTLRPTCRPQENQGIVYNGHKIVHGLKYQSALPCGIIPNVNYSVLSTFSHIRIVCHTVQPAIMKDRGKNLRLKVIWIQCIFTFKNYKTQFLINTC